MEDEIIDPTVMRPYDSYSDEEDNQENSTSGYLKVLYSDYKTKLHSATIYLQKIKEQEETLDSIVHDWTKALKEKYDILNNFQQSRPKTTVPGDFNLEDRSPVQQNDDKDLKQIDTTITDNSEQINYNFEKIEKYLKFLGSNFLDIQDTINKIFDRYMEIYDNM